MHAVTLNAKSGSSTRFRIAVDADTRETFVIAGKKKYLRLHALTAAYPELVEEQHRDAYCDLCLALHGAGRYVRIDDADAFKKTYRALLAHGETGLGDMPTAADFGPYDVSEVGAPQVRDQLLVFYVKDVRFGVPYRVEVSWPAKPEVPARIALLPLLE